MCRGFLDEPNTQSETDMLKELLHRIYALSLSPAERRHRLVGPPKLWQMKRDFQISFLKRSGLEEHHYLLDVGCGTLRGGIPIIDYLLPQRYTGVDVRPGVLEEARKEVNDAGLADKQPFLILANGTQELPSSYDFVFAFSVFMHMTDENLASTLEMILPHLKPSGVVLANVNVGEDRSEAWQGFPVVWKPLAEYESFFHRYGLDTEDLGTLRSLGHVSGFEDQDEQRMLRLTRL